jgi:hypothetical protein
MDEAREHLVSAAVILKGLVRLMQEYTAPESEAVQKLMLRHNELMLRYRHRERLVTRGHWNEQIMRKVHALGMRLVLKMATADSGVSESEVFNYCCLARKASKWGKALDEIAADAVALDGRNASVQSGAVQGLAQRYSAICRDYSLGDPVLYGRWYIEFGRMLAGNAWIPVDERHRKAWTLLIDALETSGRPAGMRAAAAW